jgi:nucleoside-diphosphate-sugar epimerase
VKILITGAGGTIGGYVCRELAGAGHDLTGFSRDARMPPGVRYVQGDVTDFETVRSACTGHEAIVHLAAIPGPGRASPERLIAVNVAGIACVLEAAVRNGIPKVVFASSNAAFGFPFQRQPMLPRYLPVDEEHPSEPQDPYGLSKLLGEIACRSYSDAYGLSTISLRINNNWYLDREGAEIAVQSGWAKGMTVEQLWSGRYRRTVEDTSDDWPSPGPVSPRKNLWAVTDARDAAQAFRLAVENASIRNEVFNINGDDTCSTIETPLLIARYFSGVPLRAPMPGHGSLVSHRKATRLLGYQPRFTWREGDFASWLRDTQTSVAGTRT